MADYVAPDYVAHLADDARPMTTACGEPWQGWQAPEDADLLGIAVIAPHEEPIPRRTRIRHCQACARRLVDAPKEQSDG